MVGILGFINDFFIDWISRFGLAGIVFATALEIIIMPIPGEIVMPYVGYVVWLTESGFGALLSSVVAGTIGNVAGSMVVYIIGFVGGKPFMTKFGKYFLSERDLVKAENLFKKYGGLAVFIGRMLPGIRTIISLPAGFFRMQLIPFLIFTSIGSVPWNLGLAYAGYSLGPYWYAILGYSEFLDVVMIIVFIVFLYMTFRHNRGSQT
jgi:membrane protein DedA with SNARE-associated domain